MVNQELFFFTSILIHHVGQNLYYVILANFGNVDSFFFFFSFNTFEKNMDKYVSVRTCLIELALHYNGKIK